MPRFVSFLLLGIGSFSAALAGLRLPDPGRALTIDLGAGADRHEGNRPGLPEARGFADCGADCIWRRPRESIAGPERIEVWGEQVPAPVAVREFIIDPHSP